MEKISKAIEELVELIPAESQEALSKVADLKSLINASNEEKEALATRYDELSKRYKTAILNDSRPPLNNNEEKGTSTPTPKSLEQCIAEVLEKRS